MYYQSRDIAHAPTGTRRRRKWSPSDSPSVWLAPLVLMLAIFAVYPFFYNIWLSFHEYAPLKRTLIYVGWDNWAQLLSDQRLFAALLVTLAYCAIALTTQVILGMVLALILDDDAPGFAFLRGVLMLTLVIPPAITGMMFLLLEDPEFGALSYALEWLGVIDASTPILATPATALAGVMLADVWQWTPFMVLIFLAGLRSLPPEPFAAALIDGASRWMIFRRLTLPMMKKVIAVAVLIRGIDLFRAFDYVFVMTSGGPGTATYTLSLYAWQQTFSFIKWGYGASISLLTLLIVLALANLFIALTKVRW